MDISSLTQKEALQTLILVEERNAHLYERVAEMFSKRSTNGQGVASAFLEMANTERQHGQLLKLRFQQSFGNLEKVIVNENVADAIEMPVLYIADILTALDSGEVRVAVRMAVDMILAVEKEATHYYLQLAAFTLDPDLRSFYKDLAAFEDAHSESVQQWLSNYPQPEITGEQEPQQ